MPTGNFAYIFLTNLFKTKRTFKGISLLKLFYIRGDHNIFLSHPLHLSIWSDLLLFFLVLVHLFKRILLLLIFIFHLILILHAIYLIFLFLFLFLLKWRLFSWLNLDFLLSTHTYICFSILFLDGNLFINILG